MSDSESSGAENVEHFLLNLYKEVCTERRWSEELSDIVSATKDMMKKIVSEAVLPYMEEYESEGVEDIDVTEAGSMADGTSICDPDEFDFTMTFTYSSDIITTRPSSNSRDIVFSKYTVKPKDPRFRQVYLHNNRVLPSLFILRNFQRLEKAIATVSDSGPVKLGENCLYLCVSDGKETYYGMQGPSFHLHNLFKWCSPNRDNDLFISVDLVPAILIKDRTVCDKVPLFKQECPCEEHDLDRPYYCLLMPVKCRDLVLSSFYHNAAEGDEVYWKAKRDFVENNFMVSLSEYENDIMKQWKCEKSIYHNWYIVYTLMKCFGPLDHSCGSTVMYQPKNIQIRGHKSYTYPERNDSFSSYSWKLIVFTMAQESAKCVTVKDCFDCLTSVFEEENLKKSQVITIASFWCPSQTAETVHLTMKDATTYTPFVESVRSLKSMLNEIKNNANYTYEMYKKRLLELFPELSSHLARK